MWGGGGAGRGVGGAVRCGREAGRGSGRGWEMYGQGLERWAGGWGGGGAGGRSEQAPVPAAPSASCLGEDGKGPLGIPFADPHPVPAPRRVVRGGRVEAAGRGQGMACVLPAECVPHTLVLRGDHLSLQAGCSCGRHQVWGEQGRGQCQVGGRGGAPSMPLLCRQPWLRLSEPSLSALSRLRAGPGSRHLGSVVPVSLHHWEEPPLS